MAVAVESSRGELSAEAGFRGRNGEQRSKHQSRQAKCTEEERAPCAATHRDPHALVPQHSYARD